jgi:hypothetical protein
MHALHILESIDDRNSRNDAFHARIRCPDYERMASTVGNAPHADALGVDPIKGFGERDRVLVVLNLVPRVEVLPRRPVAGTEPPVVEDERRTSDVDERCRVRRLHQLLDVAPTTSHDDEGMWTGPIGHVEVAADRVTVTLESHVLRHFLLSLRLRRQRLVCPFFLPGICSLI